MKLKTKINVWFQDFLSGMFSFLHVVLSAKILACMTGSTYCLKTGMNLGFLLCWKQPEKINLQKKN